ncbi:MAG: PAS domain-containing protein [Halothiobacillaceae bacterium]
MTQPTGREIRLPDDSYIVSKSDEKGIITYANRVFMQVSGYRESELLGKPHKILRHPEMPRGVFRHLWETIQRGEECFAFINNLARNGDHYWVLANVTPDFDEDHRQITGYFSCRRMASRAAIEQSSAMYRKMCAMEAQGMDPATSMKWMMDEITREYGSYEKFVLGF